MWADEINLPCSDGLPSYAHTATSAELQDALGFPGITVGSHTWSHVNLASLNAADIAAELVRSREWLFAQFGEKAISWLAYPYGLDSPRVCRAVAAACYAGALRIDGGWHRASEVSPFARPRLNVAAGLSPTGFRARLLGAMST
jgi:peptidoglycan/xylan/chitin deacetylase (PgdA/CDA1 family)